MKKGNRRAPKRRPTDLHPQGACKFCGTQATTIRAVWHCGGEASACTVRTVWPFSEETYCYVCPACDKYGDPIVMEPTVTWAPQLPTKEEVKS